MTHINSNHDSILNRRQGLAVNHLGVINFKFISANVKQRLFIREHSITDHVMPRSFELDVLNLSFESLFLNALFANNFREEC